MVLLVHTTKAMSWLWLARLKEVTNRLESKESQFLISIFQSFSFHFFFFLFSPKSSKTKKVNLDLRWSGGEIMPSLMIHSNSTIETVLLLSINRDRSRIYLDYRFLFSIEILIGKYFLFFFFLLFFIFPQISHSFISTEHHRQQSQMIFW